MSKYSDYLNSISSPSSYTGEEYGTADSEQQDSGSFWGAAKQWADNAWQDISNFAGEYANAVKEGRPMEGFGGGTQPVDWSNSTYSNVLSTNGTTADYASNVANATADTWSNVLPTPVQIGNGYTRPFDDSVYTDIPGTPTADGQLGQLEDDAVRQARMAEFNTKHPYIAAAGMGATQGFASVMGGMQSALGGGTSILDNTDKFNEATQKYRDKWNQEYGDNYFTNPNGLVTDVSNGLGSSVPIMALSVLMPGGAVAAGSARLTQALTRAGLGRFATSKIGQELIANTVRSPLSTFADSASEMGGVIHDKIQNGESYSDAWVNSLPVFAKNTVLDTLMLPTELTVMKGAKGLNLGPLGAKAGEGIGKRLAKGAARGTILAGANGLTESFQEAEQQAIEDNAKGGDLSYNPYYWNDDQWKAFRGGAVGGAVMGAPGNFIEGYRGEQETPGITGKTRQEAVDILNGIRNNDNIDAQTKQNLYNAATSNDEGAVHAAYTTLQNMQNGTATAESVLTKDDMPEDYKKKQQTIGDFIDSHTADELGDDTYNALYNATNSMNPDEIDKAFDYISKVQAQQAAQQQAQAAAARQAAQQSQVNAETYTSHAGNSIANTGNVNQDAVINAAREYNIPPAVALAIAARETGGDDVNAINMSENGGLMQITEESANDYGINDKYPDWRTDPQQNALAGMYILSQKIAENNGDVWAGVRAYNGSGSAADEYLAQVQQNYNNLGGEDASFGNGIQPYNLPTQGDDITAQVNNLTPQFQSALPTIGGILNEMGLAEGAAISSAARTPEHNAEVGGAENSYHVHNDAVDIVLPEGTTEEQAQAVLQRFKDTGAFKEVLFHDAGSGYHLHLGGYNGGLNSGGVNTSGMDETGSRDHSDTEMSDADLRQTSSENDAMLRQQLQEMDNILKAPDTNKIAGDVQQEQQAAAQQAKENEKILNGKKQETVNENAAIPEFAQYMKDTADTIEDVNTFSDMFTTDRKGRDQFIDTPQNRQFIKDNYGKALQSFVQKQNGIKIQEQHPSMVQTNISQPQIEKGGSNPTPTELIKPAQDAEQQHIDANTTNNNTVAQPQAVTEQPTPGQQAYLNKKEKLMTLVPAGKTEKIHASASDNGMDATYKVVSAADLTASHDTAFKPNRFYPAALQPRDRGRVVMQGQVEKMARTIKPELLTDSQFVNQGAPVVNKNGIVLNGNGRTMALQLAYGQNSQSAKDYKDYITKNAGKFGLTAEQISKIPNPVLVRQVGDDADVQSIINSTEGGARLGSSEQAKVDADKLKLATLERFVDNGKGEILNAGNREFLRAAVHDIATENDANTFFTSDGHITQQGVERVRNALFAKAYKDSFILARMSEATDSNSKNILKAMIAVAPNVSKVNDAIQRGEVYPEYNVSKVITDSVKKLISLRDAGKPLDYYLNETAMFQEENSAESKLMLRFMSANKFKVKNMSDAFNGLTQRALAVGNPQQSNLFGAQEIPTMEELIKNTVKEVQGSVLFNENERQSETNTGVATTESAGSGPVHRPETSGVAQETSQSESTEGTITNENTQTSESGETQQNNDENAEPRQAQAAEGTQTGEGKPNQDKVELAPGYKTSSGKLLSEADKDDFIVKPDGSVDFGYITEDIEKATNGELKKAPIRLKVGDKYQGLIHAKKHEQEAKKIGYSSIENLIDDVAQNFDAIYKKETGAKSKATYTLVKYGNKTEGIKHKIAPVYFDLEKANGQYYVVITAFPKKDRTLRQQIKKEHLIYGSPAVDATVTPNGNSVSRPASNGVGAEQRGLPTSDKSSVLSTSSVGQGREKVNAVDNAKIAPYKDAVDQIIAQRKRHEITEYEAINRLKKVMFDANSASQGQFDGMEIVKDATSVLTHEEKLAAQKVADTALGDIQDQQAQRRARIKAHAEERRKYKELTQTALDTEYADNLQKSLHAVEKVMTGYQDKNFSLDEAWHLLETVEDGAKRYGYDTNEDMKAALESAFKALEAEAKKPNPQDARFGSVEDARKAALEAAGITSPREVLTDEDIAKTGIDPNEEAKLQFHFIDQSDEALQQAKEAFKKELNNLSANPMFNPTLMYYGLKIGAIHMQRGANKFADWAANMVADMPETRPFLQSIWNTLQHLPKNGTLNEKEMTAYMRYVGAQYDHGMTDKTDLRRDFIKTLGVAKAKYFESAYEAVMNYPTTEEINAAKGDNSNVHGNAGNVAERTGQGNNQDTVGTNDENQRPTGRNGQGGGTTESGQTEHLQGRDSVSGGSTTTSGTTGNSTVQAEKSADNSGGTGNPELPRSITDSYEGNPDDAGRRPEDVVAAAQDGRNDATADDIKAEESAAQETDDSERLADVRKELPQLLPEQAGDVVFAEKRLLDANGNGVMFTNGTGTGKTYTGLGVAKRFYNRGKKNILIIAPSNDIIKQWKDAAAKDFAMPLYQLEGKQDAGKGPTITTFANVGDNQEILKRHWDAVLVDESHNLMNSKSGNVTKPLRAVRAMSRHPEGFQRYFDAVYAKETQELHDAYKAYAQADTYNAKNTKELKQKYDELKSKYEQLKEKAKQDYQGDEKAKVVFLSATPFAYVPDVDYANGYLFDYGDKQSNGYNDPSAYGQFFIENFGYRMKDNKLTKPDADVDNSVMERQFHDKLVADGALHGRVLTSNYDYDRGFILIDGGVGKSIDEGFEWLAKHREFSDLAGFIQQHFKYHERMYLLEAIKAKQAVPLIKRYIQDGKKVVIFHDYKKGGGIHPFKLLESDLRKARDEKAPWDASFGAKLLSQYEAFKRQRPDLIKLDVDKLQSPIDLFAKVFGDEIAIYNGDISKKNRTKAKNAFNDDNGKVKAILVQSDAGQAGISLHDTTGTYQRVEINLGLPTRPVAAIQEEGRIYRVGNKSNAIFRYLNTGTMMEQMAFVTKIAERASTAENLALGEQARSLKNAFITAFNESQEGDSWRKYLPGSPTEGTGGKAVDYETNNALTDYDRAKSFYFAQQKKTSRNKAAEGVDYFATPEPLGLKMVEWAGLKEGESALEPSAGHGAIARWLPENTKNTVVEPSGKLIPKLKMTTPNAKTVGSTFEDFNLVNKFNGIVMNPPFGHGGKTAVEHLAKAFKHLSNGGRIVAILPEGPSTQKHFDKWFYGNPDAKRKEDRGEEDAVLRGIIHLPKVTFGRAGTNVPTKVVIIDKYYNEADRELAKADSFASKEIPGNDVKEFFDNLAGITVPDRVDTNRKFSVTEVRNAKRRSINDLKDEIQKAFPTATVAEGENRLTMTMPNGKKVVVDFRNNIVAAEEDLARAKEEHGYDANADVIVEGFAETHGQDSYIALSQGSRAGTGFHEAFHVAHDMVLTDKEKALLNKHLGDEEAQADHYASWVEARRKGRGTAWGKLWQKIKDFARKVQTILTGVENVHNVLRKIESGHVWNRTGNESNTMHASLSPKRQLQKDVAQFGKSIDDFINNRIKDNSAIKVMTTPLVMRLTGAKIQPVYIDQSILKKILGYKHFQEVTPEILKKIPQALSDPLFIAKSDLKNKRLVVIDLKDTNGATIIVPFILEVDNDGKTMKINKIMSVYGKGTPIPNNRWIMKRINNDELLYINKKRTAHWIQSVSRAPNGPLVNGSFNLSSTIPDETDLVKLKKANPTKYSIRPKEESEEGELKPIVSPQNIIDAINDIVPIYEKSKVKPDDTGDKLYNEHSGAGFSGSYFNLAQYGRILAMHIDKTLKLKGNRELTKEVIARYDKDRGFDSLFSRKDDKNLTPAEARREGVSEFGSTLLENPELGAERYPGYANQFYTELTKNKELKEKFDTLTALIKAYQEQTVEQRASATIARNGGRIPSRKRDGMKKWLSYQMKNFYTKMVDDTNPLGQMVKQAEAVAGEKIAYEHDVQKQALMAKSNAVARTYMLLTGGKDKNTSFKLLNEIYKGAVTKKDTMQDVLDEMDKTTKADLQKAGFAKAEDALGTYLIAMRTEELAKRYPKEYARPAGFSAEECQQIIQNVPETIKKAAEHYWNVNINLVNIMQQQGLITKQLGDKLRAYKAYCPMYRDMSDGKDIDTQISDLKMDNRFVNITSPVKQIEMGGQRAVLDPVNSMICYMASAINRCERNNVGKSLVRLDKDFPGLGEIVVRDPTMQHANSNMYAFTVWVGGKKVVYRTTPEIYKALTAMNEASSNFVLEGARQIAQCLRRGATISPSFIVRNFLRDTMAASVNSKTGFIPIVSSVKGAWKLATDKKFATQYYGSGASMSTYIRSDVQSADNMIHDMLGDQYKDSKAGIKQIRKLIHMLWNKYDSFANLIEDSTRAAEFAGAMKKGLTIEQAGYLAKEVTLNFGRAGSEGRKYNRYIPFFNATIQGTDKFIRSFKENPKRSIIATMAYIVLPSLILWAFNHDDDWYRDLDEETKLSNWAISLGGEHLLIPKPQEVGILFGGGVEAVLNQMNGEDPKAMSSWAYQVVQAMTPSLFPAVFKPIIEWMANYSFWTGRPLVSQRLQKLPSEQQANQNTTELSRLLADTWPAKQLKISPIALDNFISGYFGSAGRFIAGSLDDSLDAVQGKSRPAQPAKYWYEKPFIGSFIRQDGANSEYVNQLYDLNQAISDSENRGDKKPKGKKEVETTMKTVTKLNKEIRAIQDNPKMSAEQKRLEIDKRRDKMRGYAKKAVTNFGKYYE